MLQCRGINSANGPLSRSATGNGRAVKTESSLCLPAVCSHAVCELLEMVSRLTKEMRYWNTAAYNAVAQRMTIDEGTKILGHIKHAEEKEQQPMLDGWILLKPLRGRAKRWWKKFLFLKAEQLQVKFLLLLIMFCANKTHWISLAGWLDGWLGLPLSGAACARWYLATDCARALKMHRRIVRDAATGLLDESNNRI